MMKICLVPLLSIVLATLAAGVAVAAPEEVAGMPVITDGDSIRIGKLRIRIQGIDAPEHRQLCRSARGEAYRCGHKSTHALAALIGQQPVRCLKRDVDRYGRLVAQCFAGSTDLGASRCDRAGLSPTASIRGPTSPKKNRRDAPAEASGPASSRCPGTGAGKTDDRDRSIAGDSAANRRVPCKTGQAVRGVCFGR